MQERLEAGRTYYIRLGIEDVNMVGTTTYYNKVRKPVPETEALKQLEQYKFTPNSRSRSQQ